MDFNDLSRAEHTEMFKNELWGRQEKIDPNNEHLWFDLTYGWALGKGLDPDEAKDLAIHIHYHEDLS